MRVPVVEVTEPARHAEHHFESAMKFPTERNMNTAD